MQRLTHDFFLRTPPQSHFALVRVLEIGDAILLVKPVVVLLGQLAFPRLKLVVVILRSHESKVNEI